jgi:hypothetical protein
VAQMTAYPWPGNVRELENFVRRLVVLEDPHRGTPELVAARIERSGASRELAAPPRVARRCCSLRTAFGGTLNDPLISKPSRGAARGVEPGAHRRPRACSVEPHRGRSHPEVSYKTLLTKLTECGIVPRSPRLPADGRSVRVAACAGLHQTFRDHPPSQQCMCPLLEYHSLVRSAGRANWYPTQSSLAALAPS